MSILGPALGVLAAAGLVLVGGLFALVALVLKSAATKEAEAVLPTATRGFIERARERLPEEAKPRWEEEWPAGFEEAIEKRPLWALREAIYLYLSAGRIANALEPLPASTGRFGLRAATESLSGGAGSLVGRFQSFGFRLFGLVRSLWSFSDTVAGRFPRPLRLGASRRFIQIFAFIEYLVLLSLVPIGLVLIGLLLTHQLP